MGVGMTEECMLTWQLSYTKKVVGYMQVDGGRLGDFQEGGWGGGGGEGPIHLRDRRLDRDRQTERQTGRRGTRQGQGKDREQNGMQECWHAGMLA